jgi:uncharacterized membrane protein YjjP (DUF1212 family)
VSAEQLETKRLNLVLDLCLRVGELLLSSGAGAADVSVTIYALARHFGLQNPELDVTFTSLAISCEQESEGWPLVSIRQVKQRDIDYEHLTRVDALVGRILHDDLDLVEARRELGRIVSRGHATRRWLVSLGWGVMAGAVGLQLGGGALVVALALLSAIGIDRLQLMMARRRVPFFYRQVAGGGFATLIAVGVHALGVPVDPSLVVTANIVMLLAGIGFMGALQDALSGFYITANARLLEAVLATAGIIAGVSAGLSVGEAGGAALGEIVPGQVGIADITVAVVGAALGAAAFAFASYAPRRSLLPVALISALAMLVYQAMMQQNGNRAWASGVAALCVGLVSYAVAGRVGVPPLVVVVPAVVPMLPGLSIFRGLSLVTEGGTWTSEGLLAMVTAASVAMALAAGVILGEYLAQPVKREARRLENRLVGPRLVGPQRIHSARRRVRRGATD